MDQEKHGVSDVLASSINRKPKPRCGGMTSEVWKTAVAAAVGILLISLAVWTMTVYNMKIVELSDRLRILESDTQERDTNVRRVIDKHIEQV